MLVWVFIKNFAYRSRGNLQICVIIKHTLDYPLIRLFLCSFSFTVSWLLAEHFSKIQCGERNLIPTSLNRKKTYEMAVAKSLSVIKYSARAAALYCLPILTFGVLACTFTLYADNLSRNMQLYVKIILIVQAVEYKGCVWLSFPFLVFCIALNLEGTTVFYGKHSRQKLSDGLRSYSSFKVASSRGRVVQSVIKQTQSQREF